MIEIEMSRDIKEYSPKVLAFFDKKQIVCVSIAFAYTFPILLGWGPFESLEITTRLFIVILAGAPTVACGWIKIYGIPVDQFFIQTILPMYLSPTKRKYKTKDQFPSRDVDPLLRNYKSTRKKSLRDRFEHRKQLKKFEAAY